MAALGVEFPPLKLSDCCRFGKPTSAGANGNEKDAPTDGVSRRLRLRLGC